MIRSNRTHKYTATKPEGASECQHSQLQLFSTGIRCRPAIARYFESWVIRAILKCRARWEHNWTFLLHCSLARLQNSKKRSLKQPTVVCFPLRSFRQRSLPRPTETSILKLSTRILFSSFGKSDFFSTDMILISELTLRCVSFGSARHPPVVRMSSAFLIANVRRAFSWAFKALARSFSSWSIKNHICKILEQISHVPALLTNTFARDSCSDQNTAKITDNCENSSRVFVCERARAQNIW